MITEQVAFFSLARRLGNPLASSPEAEAAVDAFDVLLAYNRLSPSQKKIVRLTLGCLARLRRAERPLQSLRLTTTNPSAVQLGGSDPRRSA